MAIRCTDNNKFRTTEARAKSILRTQGAIDKFLNILNLNLFRLRNKEWSSSAREKYGIQGNLFSEDQMTDRIKAVPNKEAFKTIDRAEGINYQIDEVPVSTASPETLSKVKKVIEKMGIDVQKLSDYLKGNPNIDARGVNALADLMRGVIAIAEGKEDVALTEEMVHIATAALEQTKPQLITEMISKIGNFKIYTQVLNAYKNNPAYQTKDGKPDIRKIKKEAVDKLIAELIINENEGSTEFPELLEETNKSTVRIWWQKILAWFRDEYKKANIDIFENVAKKIMNNAIAPIYRMSYNASIDENTIIIDAFVDEDKIGGIILQKTQEDVYHVRMANSNYENIGIGTLIYREAIKYVTERNGILKPDVMSSAGVLSIYKKLEQQGLFVIDSISEKTEDDRYVIEGHSKGVIPEGLSEIFYQISEAQKKLQEKILYTKENVRKVESSEKVEPILLDTEEANNWYEYKTADGWERIKKRVTDRVEAWYKARFPDKDFTKEEKEFNEFKRLEGVKGHKFLEEIHNRYFNPDGTLREKVGDRPSLTDPVDKAMYIKLEKYYIELKEKFFKDGKTPLVFSEVIVYDPKEKEAGTIDLLIVEENGKANIIDWKFMSVAKDANDIPWYKQGAFNIQLGRYKDILLKQYGIKEIGMNRAVPILLDIKYRDYRDDNSKHSLKGIVVGSVDTSKIENLLLVPVSEAIESTAVVMEGSEGFEKLDNLIKKLNALYKQVAKKQVTDEEDREFKRERLNALKMAIRAIQGSANLAPLIKVISLMRAEGEMLKNDWDMKYKDVSSKSNNFTNDELSEYADNIREYLSVASIFKTIDRTLGSLIYSPDMEKDASYSKEDLKLRKDVLEKIQSEATEIDENYEKMEKIAGEFANKFIGIRNLVKGLLDPKAIIRGLSATFRGISDLPLPSLQVLYKMVTNAKAYASRDALGEVNELTDIYNKLKARGGDIRELVKKIYQKDDKDKLVNKLIYRYKKDFYDGLKNNAIEGRRDKKWIFDNVDIEAYKQQAEEVLEKRIKRIEKLYEGDKDRMAELIQQEKRKFNIDSPNFNGWNNYLLKRNPIDKWESEEYKELKKDEDLLNLYNFIHRMNDKAVEAGYISNRVSSTFLPYIRKGLAESLAWDFSLSAVMNWSKNLNLRAGDVGYGQVNELTGEYEYAIPKYYTYDFSKEEGGSEEVSEDIFKNMILYINHMEKYKYLSDIEGQLLLVKNIEQFKKHLDTARNGDVIFNENGKPEALEGNEENSRMFDVFLRALLYEQKYPLSEGDTPMNIGKVTNYIKRALGKVVGKDIPIEDNPSPTSLIKSIDAVNRAFQLKTLGFEFVSGAVNLFGLNIQMATQAGHYFTEKEFIKNEIKLLGNKFNGDEEREKFIQLIDTFMPLKEDPTYEKLKKAGMSKLTRTNFSDIIMWFMRNPELHAEKSVFATLLQNMMVENGKIVSITEYVKSKYKDRYNSADEYRKFKQAIKEEIEELKSTRSIESISKIENGALVIPGLDLNNREEIQRLTNLTRRISRNATGGLSDSDLNNMSLNVWTKSMMVFKNWIPKLIDTRFGELRKIHDDFSVEIDDDELTTGEKYDIGRLRLFGSLIGLSIRDKGNYILNILKMNEKGIKYLDSLYEEYATKYEKRTGEDFTLSKEEFIDMIKLNLANQMREFAMLISLLAASISLGFIGPDDDDNKADKNFFRFWQRVFDRFIQELSFFYNPIEFQKILSGSVFPAIGLMSDVMRASHHFFMQTTGLDFSNPDLTIEEVREKAQLIKNVAKLFPGTKSIMTYGSIFSEDFAKEFDITIQKETKR